MGLKHLEFANGAQTLPLFIPLILDVLQASPLLETLFIETCCILPDPRYVCTVATLLNLRRLRVTSGAVSKVLHLIVVPPSASIEIARSFCDIAEPGVNVLSCLHEDLPWINFGWRMGCYYSPQYRRHVRQDGKFLWRSCYHRREGYTHRSVWLG